MAFSVKHNIEFPEMVIIKDLQRLSNQIWKCIPMRENEEDWKKQLNTVSIEVAGLAEIFMSSQFLQLLSKIEGLQQQDDINFELYRKTIFECLSLLQELNHNAR